MEKTLALACDLIRQPSVTPQDAGCQQQLMQRLRAIGFHCTAMRFGEPTEEIERFIADEGVDLVAMTTHGRTGLARMMFGSVAEHVLHHSKAPIMLYRSFANGTPEKGAAA